MAKKKEEIKENEELQEKVVTETTEKVEETKKEEVISTGETTEELAGEKIEAPAEDAKVEENESNTEQDAQVQPTINAEDKVPTVKEVFKDKYDEKVVYKVGDTFILDEEIKDNKPVKVEDGKYKVSKARYEELQRSLYVD